MQKTKWFSCRLFNPCRIGAYEVCGKNGMKLPYPFYWWDGSSWSSAGKTPRDAAADAETSNYKPDLASREWFWRGILKD